MVRVTLRHADGGQRPAVRVLVGGLLLLLADHHRAQVGAFLLQIFGPVTLAAAVHAARQLVDTERVVDVVRVGADRLVVSSGHHNGHLRYTLHHRRRHRALVLGRVRREWCGR